MDNDLHEFPILVTNRVSPQKYLERLTAKSRQKGAVVVFLADEKADGHIQCCSKSLQCFELWLPLALLDQRDFGRTHSC